MSKKKRPIIIPILLVLLPAWLIISAGLGLVKNLKDEEEATQKAEQLFARDLSSDLIADDLNKLVTLIGERNTATPEKLAATASMLQGLLGPSNTGYLINLTKGPADFPIIQVTVQGAAASAGPIWVLTSYDSPPGSRGAEKNATGLAATLAAAQALANSTPSHPIHFLFLPHANEPDSPLAETALSVASLIKNAPQAKAILCVEAMGARETLILTGRDTESLPTKEFAGLGEILGAEIICLGDDSDLASTLFEMNLPALRIATRPTLLPEEKDEKLPFAPTVTAAAGRLLELIKRLAK